MIAILSRCRKCQNGGASMISHTQSPITKIITVETRNFFLNQKGFSFLGGRSAHSSSIFSSNTLFFSDSLLLFSSDKILPPQNAVRISVNKLYITYQFGKISAWACSLNEMTSLLSSMLAESSPPFRSANSLAIDNPSPVEFSAVSTV